MSQCSESVYIGSVCNWNQMWVISSHVNVPVELGCWGLWSVVAMFVGHCGKWMGSSGTFWWILVCNVTECVHLILVRKMEDATNLPGV